MDVSSFTFATPASSEVPSAAAGGRRPRRPRAGAGKFDRPSGESSSGARSGLVDQWCGQLVSWFGQSYKVVQCTLNSETFGG